MGTDIGCLHSSFWGDPVNRLMPLDEKLLFIFLLSYRAPSGGSVSGVYQIAVADMAYFTRISERKIPGLLTNLRNVLYDADNFVVCVLNKMRYRLKIGKQEKLLSIVGDYRITWKSNVWPQWVEHNRLYCELQPSVEKILLSGKPAPEQVEFHKLIGYTWRGKKEEAKPEPEEGGKRVEQITELELESRFAELVTPLVYYVPADKIAELTAILARAYDELCTSLATGKPRVLGVRLAILERWEKSPLMQLLFAAKSWVDQGCYRLGKREQYFVGILNNSALSDYIDWKNRRDKKKFELGDK